MVSSIYPHSTYTSIGHSFHCIAGFAVFNGLSHKQELWENFGFTYWPEMQTVCNLKVTKILLLVVSIKKDGKS